MNKRILNVEKRDNVGVDYLDVQVNFHAHGFKWQAYKPQYDSESKSHYIALAERRRVYISRRTSDVQPLTYRVHLNGYELLRKHLTETKSIDFSGHESAALGAENFIPIAILRSEKLPWRTLWRRILARLILDEAQAEKNTVLAELNKIADAKIEFESFSLYRIEVSIDVDSPIGTEFPQMPMVKNCLNALQESATEMVMDQAVPGKGKIPTSPYEVKNVSNGFEGDVPILAGYTPSGAGLKSYTKERSPLGNLNRLELTLRDGDLVRKEMNGIGNSFKSVLRLMTLLTILYDCWFATLYRVLNVEYEIEDGQLLKLAMDEIGVLHPNRPDLLCKDLFPAGNWLSSGKVSVHAKYLKRTGLDRLIAAKILYKPNCDKANRQFYAISPLYRKRLIRQLRGLRP